MNPGASPWDDATLVNAKCYQYRTVVVDNVGNTDTFGVAKTIKVDTQPPTITWDQFI